MSERVSTLSVVDNRPMGRLEAEVEGHIAFVSYLREGETVHLVHTEVPRELEGRGVGTALAKAVLDWTKAKGFRTVVRCPFIKAFIARHPEYA